MAELVTQNWILLVIALLIGILVAWWVLAASSRKRVTIEREEKPDDQAPARRNQALIDAPPASGADATPPSAAPLASTGEVPATPEPAPIPEPITPAAPQAPASPAPAVPADSADDLTRIKGLGPKLAEQLHAMGVTSFSEIAGWSDADIDRIDEQLGRFRGRIRRDDWPQQAKLLAAGDLAGYESRFGKL